MVKNKLFILVGKSGSGKSTIESKIDKIGVAKKVISSTTRNTRSNEKNGLDYYFISEEEFQEKLERGLFAEHSEYPTVNGMAKYGMQMKDIKLNEGNNICVVNPDGMTQVLDNLGKENCITIYIERDDRERVCSTLLRDKSKDFGKVLEEATRRYKSDEIDFAEMKDICDYVVINEVLDNAVNRVLDIIENSI
jgi:guanylate kinase